MTRPYVTHTCLACGVGYNDIDKYNATTLPPKGYCPDCQAIGYRKEKDPAKVARAKLMRTKKKEDEYVW